MNHCRKWSSPLPGALILTLMLGAVPAVAQNNPAPNSANADDAEKAALRERATELAQSRADISPELQRIKELAGKWHGTTFRASEGTNPAEMTYTVTGRGSAVVEVMFPGKPNEMTTVYHDDINGHLVAEHYCTAMNQPRLRMVESDEGHIKLVFADGESDVEAHAEGHAHELNITFNENGTLTHDWLNHYLGEPAAKRNFELQRVE